MSIYDEFSSPLLRCLFASTETERSIQQSSISTMPLTPKKLIKEIDPAPHFAFKDPFHLSSSSTAIPARIPSLAIARSSDQFLSARSARAKARFNSLFIT
jgi:hypothetical protein